MATMLILLDLLLTSLTMCSSSDLLTSHLSNVTFNLVQQRLTEPNLPPQKCAASRLWPSGAKLVKSATQSLINYHQL